MNESVQRARQEKRDIQEPAKKRRRYISIVDRQFPIASDESRAAGPITSSALVLSNGGAGYWPRLVDHSCRLRAISADRSVQSGRSSKNASFAPSESPTSTGLKPTRSLFSLGATERGQRLLSWKTKCTQTKTNFTNFLRRSFCPRGWYLLCLQACLARDTGDQMSQGSSADACTRNRYTQGFSDNALTLSKEV